MFGSFSLHGVEEVGFTKLNKGDGTTTPWQDIIIIMNDGSSVEITLFVKDNVIQKAIEAMPAQ